MKENFWFVNGKKVTVSQEVYSLLRYSYAKEREIESGMHTKKYSQETIYFTELQPWHFQKQTGWMEEKVLDRVMVEQIMESLSEKERYFVREYFWKERSIRSIARSMRVTERTVYRFRDSVLTKIREKFL